MGAATGPLVPEPIPQIPVVEKKTETHETTTTKGPAEPDTPPTLAASVTEVERTRRLVTILIFLQFNIFVIGMTAAMVFRGYELSPVASNLFGQIFQTEALGMAGAIGFYLGSSYGSALKDMLPKREK